MKYPDSHLPWPIDFDAVKLIAEKEQGPRGGAALKAYRCPAGVPTIGWGRTEGVTMGDTCTQEQADRWLCDSLAERSKAIAALCKVEPNDNQLGAMTSLQYNIGAGAFRSSTVLKRHNVGDFESAATAFSLFDKSRVHGVLTQLPGLVARRAAEAALYLRVDPDDAQHPMPQAVEPQTRLTSSPIAQIGTGLTLTGALTGLNNAGDAAGRVGMVVQETRRTVVEGLGVPDGMFLPLVMLAGGAGVVWWRLKQRRSGRT